MRETVCHMYGFFHFLLKAIAILIDYLFRNSVEFALTLLEKRVVIKEDEKKKEAVKAFF